MNAWELNSTNVLEPKYLAHWWSHVPYVRQSHVWNFPEQQREMCLIKANQTTCVWETGWELLKLTWFCLHCWCGLIVMTTEEGGCRKITLLKYLHQHGWHCTPPHLSFSCLPVLGKDDGRWLGGTFSVLFVVLYCWTLPTDPVRFSPWKACR